MNWIKIDDQSPVEGTLVFIRIGSTKRAAYFEHGYFWKIEGCCDINLFRQPITDVYEWKDARGVICD